MQSYTPPAYSEESFHCPLCGFYAHQYWFQGCCVQTRVGGKHQEVADVSFCRCEHCGSLSVWRKGMMIYPDGGNAPLPNPDLPGEVVKDYEEARSILAKSPRGAAALLRLSIQKLCHQLGESGKDLNADIGSLVEKGLPEKVRQALDALRVIGNNAVHPGQIDLTDDADTATALFGLVNFIAEKMITEPKEIERLHALLPPGAIEQIKRRDGVALRPGDADH